MNSLIRRSGARLALVCLGILVGTATVAFASGHAIGDGGAINACYRVADDDRKGDLRVVNDPSSCRAGEAPLNWNQNGIQNVLFYEESEVLTVPANAVEVATIECQQFDWAASAAWELGPGLTIERIQNVFQNSGARMFHVRNENDSARQVRLAVNCVFFAS